MPKTFIIDRSDTIDGSRFILEVDDIGHCELFLFKSEKSKGFEGDWFFETIEAAVTALVVDGHIRNAEVFERARQVDSDQIDWKGAGGIRSEA
jgi:hypothetical protein